jgi:hypothetical protein
VQDTDQAMLIRDLEQTVAAMRDALELKDREAAERTQRAVAGTAAENAELQATIRALRVELEAAHEARAAAVQELERLHRAELDELRETVQALRARLEEHAGG